MTQVVIRGQGTYIFITCEGGLHSDYGQSKSALVHWEEDLSPKALILPKRSRSAIAQSVVLEAIVLSPPQKKILSPRGLESKRCHTWDTMICKKRTGFVRRPQLLFHKETVPGNSCGHISTVLIYHCLRIDTYMSYPEPSSLICRPGLWIYGQGRFLITEKNKNTKKSRDGS